MSFAVNHDAVRIFAGTVGGLTEDADKAVGYARDHLGIGYADGRMFATVVETATSVREALVANYSALARLMDASERQLSAAANQYRDTDQSAAARVDAIY